MATDYINVLINDAGWAWPDAVRQIFNDRDVQLLLAKNADQALNILQHRRIHTAIVDMDCQTGGLAVIKMIRSGFPLLPCILIAADKVIVERIEAESKTAGGIVLPDSAKEKPQRGKVISVGAGKLLDDGARSKMQVKKGDEVLFTSYAGTEVKLDGKEYLIMDESDIMAIIEK